MEWNVRSSHEIFKLRRAGMCSCETPRAARRDTCASHGHGSQTSRDSCACSCGVPRAIRVGRVR